MRCTANTTVSTTWSGVKVGRDARLRGGRSTRSRPTRREMLDVIGRRARDHDREIYVHVNDHRGVEIALGLGAHALTHLVLDDPQAGQVERMREAGMHVMTTMAIVDGFADRHRPGVADTPRVRLTVSEVERETARDPAAWDRWGTTFMRIVAPSLPEWFARWYADWQLSEAWVASVVRSLQDALMRYHEAGVPIVMGTDSGGWPHMVHAFHGPTALRELQLMADAGMTPAQVLRAATVTPARMMGILDQVGTVEVGKRADLIVVRGRPAAGHFGARQSRVGDQGRREARRPAGVDERLAGRARGSPLSTCRLPNPRPLVDALGWPSGWRDCVTHVAKPGKSAFERALNND